MSKAKINPPMWKKLFHTIVLDDIAKLELVANLYLYLGARRKARIRSNQFLCNLNCLHKKFLLSYAS